LKYVFFVLFTFAGHVYNTKRHKTFDIAVTGMIIVYKCQFVKLG